MTMTLHQAGLTGASTSVSYQGLTPRQQDAFHRALKAAAQATNVWHIKDIHEFTAAALDIDLPHNDELVECSCEMCPDACDRIAPLSLCAEYLDGDTQRPQCPACADDHRITSD
ncbi:hypothetical protein [Streptomyces tubercidicus]|uniref:hypothetical protein n=1 Tax=Streptomyces tubercidicus TaxID=47759 RepID=UPI0034656F9E